MTKKKSSVSKSTSDPQLVVQLIENNIALQKKTTDLLVGMNSLTKKVGGLVNLFEDAAKRIKPGMDEEGVKPLLEKLDMLTEQNKTIARGLVLLEEYIREKRKPFQPRPLPEF
tara:strand:- start:1776 stop:2114 length:339 start_codon:yes stop_codon:yes gene_type:complete